MEIIVVTLLFVALISIAFINYRLFIKKHRTTAFVLTPFTIALLASTIVFTSLVLDKGTYERLTNEHTVAIISFENINPQQFKATIEPAFSAPVTMEIRGDQWQLDARIFKWKGVASYLGLQPLYLLERISGRYQAISDEVNKQRSVIALNLDDSFSYWNSLIKHQDLIPWLDAYYGNAVYLPMKHGAKFMITIGQQGLIARPRNLQASRSLKEWVTVEDAGA